MTVTTPAPDPLDELLTRVDHELLRRRMLRQVEHYLRLFGHGRGGLHLENLDFLFRWLEGVLELAGVAALARRGALALQTTHHVFRVPGLPPAFDGLRVLHLSDLHLDCQHPQVPPLGRHFARAIEGLAFDLCVITGDFRFRSHGDYLRVADEVAALAPALRCELGVYGVLGNHDVIELVPYLERAGVRVLLNEAVPLRRGGDELWLVGLDDPHFFGTHDLSSALASVPAEALRLALVHSPELAEELARAGIALYLTGHTHAGQLCLPGGITLYSDARCPRGLTKGRWRLGAMQGYTSAGLGFSGLPARLHCPPELALHELRAG